MRRRSPSYSPPPRRGYSGRGHSPIRGRYGRRRDAPTSLLVRNIPRDSRAEDIRTPFERFGAVKDVYLPKDYYTREPRGFGFVKYFDSVDAAEAKHYMDHQVFNGREITVVFAEENRKGPDEMRIKGRSRGRLGDRGHRRSPYYARSRSRSRSHSPQYHSPSSKGGRRSMSYSPAPKQGHYSRSPTPARVRKHVSRSPSCPRKRVQDRSPSAGRSRTPARSHGNSRSASISPLPKRVARSPRRQSRSRSLSRKDSRSPLQSPSLPSKRRQSLPLRRSLSSNSLESSHKKTYSNLTPEERSPERESPPIMRTPDH